MKRGRGMKPNNYDPVLRKFVERPISVRFDELTIPVPECGCLLWEGAWWISGYGMFKIAGKQVRAHRVAWKLAGRTIPAGLLVCHKCDTPACVNVNHLFLGTNADNCHDRDRKGRGRWKRKVAAPATKTE